MLDEMVFYIPNGRPKVKSPFYIDRIERKYQVGIEDGVADLRRELSKYLPKYGLNPIDEITSVGSVYFDNKDYDLLRYIFLIERGWILVRLRVYEDYGRPPEPIPDYWVEVKIKKQERRKKKRFRIKRENLADFFEGKDVEEKVLEYNQEGTDPEVIRSLFRETRETVLSLGLKPTLLVTYKRVAFQNDIERLTLEWDVQYYHVDTDVYSYDSWKYSVKKPSGKANKIILELKSQGSLPAWFSDLQRRCPIWETDYLKPLEGMGFLFQGPLKHHKEANSFLQMIEAYMARSQPLG